MKKEKIKIAIVEDNPFFNQVLKKYMQSLFSSSVYLNHEFEIKTYLTAEECLENLEDDLDIMLLDYLLINKESDEYLTGLDVLEEVNKNCLNCKVIMISEQQNMIVTVESLKRGAYDYIDKNLNSNNRIGAVVQKILRDRSKIAH